MEVAIEASSSWYWLYDNLESEGFDVKLSHPLKTKAIAYARVKTDKVDSTTLARLLRSDLLPLSYVPGKPVRLNRELLRYRARLLRVQTRIKNNIYTILAKNNVSHSYSGEDEKMLATVKLARLLCEDTVKSQRIADLVTYIENNRDGLYGSRSLRDKVEAKMVLVCSTGAMEKNIDIVIDRRFKRYGQSWTTEGGE